MQYFVTAEKNTVMKVKMIFNHNDTTTVRHNLPLLKNKQLQIEFPSGINWEKETEKKKKGICVTRASFPASETFKFYF